MFRKKAAVPAVDIERVLPKLRAYAKEHYQPKEKPETEEPEDKYNRCQGSVL